MATECAYIYISVETGLRLTDGDDSVVCYVLAVQPGLEVPDPPDRFLAHRRFLEGVSIYRRPGDSWVVMPKMKRGTSFQHEKQLMDFKHEHLVPVEVVNYLKDKPPNTKVWLRGPPRHKDWCPPTPPTPVPVEPSATKTVPKATTSKPVPEIAKAYSYSYISVETGQRLTDGDDSVVCYVLACEPGLDVPDPPDRFLAHRRMGECVSIYLLPDKRWIMMPRLKRGTSFQHEKQLMDFKHEHLVPVEVVNYLRDKPPNTKVWLRGPPRHKDWCPPRPRPPPPSTPVPPEPLDATKTVTKATSPKPVSKPIRKPAVAIKTVTKATRSEPVPEPAAAVEPTIPDPVPKPAAAAEPPIPDPVPEPAVAVQPPTPEPVPEPAVAVEPPTPEPVTEPAVAVEPPTPEPVPEPAVAVETPSAQETPTEIGVFPDLWKNANGQTKLSENRKRKRPVEVVDGPVSVPSNTKVAPETNVAKKTSSYLKRGTLCNIRTFFGYDHATEKYAIKYEGDDTTHWLRKDYFYDTDARWLDMAKKHGMPSYDRDSKSFRPLVGGVLTRRQLAASSSYPRTSGVPVEYNDGGILCCLTASYLNLAASKLSEEQRASIVNVAISESQLTKKLCDDAFPLRMTHPLLFIGAPRKAGDYLISLTDVHIDGLRVLSTGGLLFFPSDPRVSTFVLTEEDDYVQEHILNRVHPYRAIQIVAARAPAILSKAERRALAKKTKKLTFTACV